MRPTPRSVHARQPSKSFDGGCREDTLQRTEMIRKFPKNAMMDRGTPKAEMIIL